MTTIPSGPPDIARRSQDDDTEASRKPKQNAGTGLQAATIRAVTARAAAFYFRAPVKAFFRSRIDYMGYARAINPSVQAGARWSWKMTTPAVLAHAVRTHGWRFLPNQVLPPLMANTFVGAVLYTAYLQSLSSLHEPSSRSTKRVWPPPSVSQTFTAGLMAGSIQSLLAAPLDALQVRFQASDMLDGKYKNMWTYASHKLREIGLRGIFAGWSLGLLKDSLGSAVFFTSFEWTKSQGYYKFLSHYYGLNASARFYDERGWPIIKPHYTLEPTFLLLAGITASIASQTIQHPLTELQTVHYGRLESLDHQAHEASNARGIMRRYYHAYEETFEQCAMLAKRAGGWRKYLYRDFFWSTIRQVPSTSAGLIAFELVRRKYAFEREEVKIEMEGFDVLLA